LVAAHGFHGRGGPSVGATGRAYDPSGRLIKGYGTSAFSFTNGKPTLTKAQTRTVKKASKLLIAEGQKAKRKRLRKMALSGDPRQRLWAVGQLDEMSMSRLGENADLKSAVAQPAKKKTRRDERARLLDQAFNHSDPFARLRAQDALRGVTT
jgi:hypothetical protein